MFVSSTALTKMACAGTNLLVSTKKQRKRTVMRCNLGTREARPVIQAYAETSGHTKDIDRAGIGPEIMGRVLSRDAALHGVRIRLEDRFLRESDFC
jgi:hypothetical protein